MIQKYIHVYTYVLVHVNLMMEKQEEISLIFELCGKSDFYDFSCVQFRTVATATVYRPHWLRLVNSSKCVIFNANHCLFFSTQSGNTVVPSTKIQNQTNNWREYSLFFSYKHFVLLKLSLENDKNNNNNNIQDKYVKSVGGIVEEKKNYIYSYSMVGKGKKKQEM